VAVVLNGPAHDGGWNSIWMNSVDGLKRAIPGTQVTVVPNINPGASAQQAAKTLAAAGNKLVVLTGGYADSDLRTAMQQFPGTKFLNLFGTTTGKNLAPFSAAIEEGRYLDGIVAGSMTKTNVLGEVGGYPIPFEARTLDAFAMGVHSVNPKAKIKILWVNSFYDPAGERQAAQAEADAGADVLVMDSNTPAVASVVRARHLMLVGYGISRAQDVQPNEWLGTFSYNWTPYLTQWAKAVSAGSWQPQLYYEGVKQGVIGSTAWGSHIPASVIAKVNAARQQIMSGKLHVFTGPISSNTGKTVVPAGSALSTAAQVNACCTWLASNVEGNLK
jgi:basic membrane lipoprotein Med (substrate-binding protein (PBP1-ABC) superfamily)